MSDNNNKLDPVQEGTANFLILAFAVICGCPAAFGALWLFSTYFLRPELQTMPDQYGNVWSGSSVLCIGGALIVIPLFIFMSIYGKLSAAKRGDV